MLPAASYRRPAFEPINLADADFGVGPATTPAMSVSVQNGFAEPVEPEEVAPLLDIDFTYNENASDGILDPMTNYQYKQFSSNVPLDPYVDRKTLKDFRPDLLESYDSSKESDKTHSLDDVQRLPDVASCPVLITSPDSSKDDCTISSDISYGIYGNSSADVITPQSELSDELIAEKPLICDDSVSETKDTLSSETSNDLLINDHNEPKEDSIKEPLLTEEEKVILKEIFEDSSNININFEEDTTDEKLEEELEKILEASVEEEVRKDVPQKDLSEHNDIPDVSIVSDSNLLLEYQLNEPVEVVNQKTEEKSLVAESVAKVSVEDNELLLEPQVDCVDPPEKEPTDSLCSIESTETILLKDDNQMSNNTVSDSLDSQSTCSLPSEVAGDSVEHIEENCLQRPNTLDFNETTGYEVEHSSTLSTGKYLSNFF